MVRGHFGTMVCGGPGAGVDAESDGQLGSFGDVLMDVEAGSGWGHAVAWSPSGLHVYAPTPF